MTGEGQECGMEIGQDFPVTEGLVLVPGNRHNTVAQVQGEG